MSDEQLNLRLVGLNHRTAPLELRESLYVPEYRLADALLELRSVDAVEEGFILSTCNRIEVVAQVADEEDHRALTAFLGDYHGVAVESLEDHLYRLVDEDVLRHLFRVTASLDSLVLGEPQIVGQVRESLRAARKAGAVGPVLNAVFDKALMVARRVRSETGLAENAVSVSYAAVELAKKIFGELEGRRALLLGAGEMSELAAKHLVKHGVDAVMVSNRSRERAVELAEVIGGQVVGWDRALDELTVADIVLASTAAPHPVVTVDAVERAMPRRRYRPIFLIDIAVPRDVEAAVNEIDNVYLYDIDDLQSVVDENRAARAREAEVAEAMIREEVVTFQETIKSWRVTPTIVALRQAVEEMRRDELSRISSVLRDLDPAEAEAVEELTRRMLNKMLHGAIHVLKEDARNGAGLEASRLVRRMWDLDRGKGAGDEPEGGPGEPKGEAKEDR